MHDKFNALFSNYLNILIQVLSDETKRKQYDQWGTAGDFSGSASSGGFQGFSSHIDPEELFRNIFQGFRTGFPESDYAEQQFGFGSHEVNF